MVPRISLADLEKRGRTELVSVMIPLETVTADELAPEVKKLLGPSGEVVSVARVNSLLVTDTAGSVRRVVQIIKDIGIQNYLAKQVKAAE